MNMNHMYRTILSGVMILLTAACGGGEEGTSTSKSSVSTIQVKGTVNSGEIGGSNLAVLSAQQESTSPIQGETFTTTISTRNPQLLFIQDGDNVARGLTFSIRTDLSDSTPPTLLPADATSTALALLLLSPGVTPPDWSYTQPVITAIQSLPSFPALVAFLEAHLKEQSLPEIITNPTYGPLLEACLTEWPTKLSAIKPLSSPNTSVAAFAVQPIVSPISTPPSLDTGGIFISLPEHYLDPNNIKATFANHSFRSARIYEFRDLTGTGSPLTLTGSSEWLRGGDGPNTLSLLGIKSKGLVPRTMSKNLVFHSPDEKLHYYIVGAGFAASPVVPPPGIGGFADLGGPIGYDIAKYVIAPALSFIYGGPVSDILDTVVTTLDGLNDPSSALVDLKTQIVKVSTETILSAEAVLAYRVLLKEYSRLSLGQLGQAIKGTTRGLLQSVFRIGALYDAANFIFYVDDLIHLPRYAKLEVTSPYDTIEFADQAISFKKTDGTIHIGLTRTDGSKEPLTVEYALAPGTALESIDYKDASTTPGIVQFASAQTTATIPIQLISNPSNTGFRTAALSLGKVRGLGKVGQHGALTLTIGSGSPLNVCEPDVQTYAPSGCEWPRIVAKNPFTPLQAGQPVPLSELVEYRPGTCSQLTQMLFGLPLRDTEWSLEGLPDPYPYNEVQFSFLQGPDVHGPSILELSSVRLRPNTSTDRNIHVRMVYNYLGNSQGTLYQGSFGCIFSLRSDP
nr:hypothetical protein [Nitrosomonas nitrosa]